MIMFIVMFEVQGITIAASNLAIVCSDKSINRLYKEMINQSRNKADSEADRDSRQVTESAGIKLKLENDKINDSVGFYSNHQQHEQYTKYKLTAFHAARHRRNVSLR